MYRFLSPAWVDEMRKIRDEYRDRVDATANGLVTQTLRVNLVVTDMPDGAPDVHAHTVTAPDGSDLDLGHLDDAAVVVTVDYATARDVVLDQDLASVMRAFLFGSLSIDGDIGVLFDDAADRDPLALLSALNLAGIQGLGDLDPLAAEIGERVRAATA